MGGGEDILFSISSQNEGENYATRLLQGWSTEQFTEVFLLYWALKNVTVIMVISTNRVLIIRF